MQVGSDLPNAIDDDVVGQESVHPIGKRFGVGQLLFNVEVGVIVARMDTRVGAPAARDGDRLAQLETHALLQGLLHALTVRLDLIAVVAATVVGQMDEITWHNKVLKAQR